MRLLAGLIAVSVLAGCGAMATRSGAPAKPGATLADAPPLQALDEAPPTEFQHVLDEQFAPVPADFGAGTSSTKFFTWGTDSVTGKRVSSSSTLTPAQLTAFRARLDAQHAAVAPASDSPPRLVARLPLAGGGDALFVAWRNRKAVLCTATQLADIPGPNGSSSGGGGAGGPCAASAHSQCDAICLTSSGSGSDAAHMIRVLSGTVAADADAIDVTTADGATAEYPLTGPTLGGARRVFMLELGAADWRKLTLLRAGQVVDETAMSAAAVASEDCMAKAGPPWAPGQTAGMQDWKATFEECIAAKAP